MTRVRWATPEDVRIYYDGEPRPTLQAVVLEVDGELLAMGGIYYHGNRIIAFSDLKPGAEKYGLSIMRGSKMIVELMRKKRRPIYAVREEGLDSAPGFLAHFGFEQTGEYYEWRP